MTLPNASTVCQRCHATVVPVDVAGHTQCPDCNQVIDECCSGESVSHTAEAELVGEDPGIATTDEPLLAYHVVCRGCGRPNTGYGTRPSNCAFCGVGL